jgi:hypothetical protein
MYLIETAKGIREKVDHDIAVDPKNQKDERQNQ